MGVNLYDVQYQLIVLQPTRGGFRHYLKGRNGLGDRERGKSNYEKYTYSLINFTMDQAGPLLPLPETAPAINSY